jgi:hypothetical protein
MKKTIYDFYIYNAKKKRVVDVVFCRTYDYKKAVRLIKYMNRDKLVDSNFIVIDKLTLLKI